MNGCVLSVYDGEETETTKGEVLYVYDYLDILKGCDQSVDDGGWSDFENCQEYINELHGK